MCNPRHNIIRSLFFPLAAAGAAVEATVSGAFVLWFQSEKPLSSLQPRTTKKGNDPYRLSCYRPHRFSSSKRQRYLPGRQFRRQPLVQCDVSRLVFLDVTRRRAGTGRVELVIQVGRRPGCRDVHVEGLGPLDSVRSIRFEAVRIRQDVVDALAFGWREVERVDDAVLLQTFVHFVHFLADRVDDVLLVLTTGLLVGLHLLALPAPAEANDGQARHDGHQRHGRRDSGDQDDLTGRQTAIRIRDHGRSAAHVRNAQVQLALAPLAAESARARAPELVDSAQTSSAVEAGPAGALIHLDGTILSSESGPAGALVVVDQVVADASVGARLGQTVVDVALAQRSDESGHTQALERVDQILTRSAVEARIVRTIVDIRLALVARESGRTDALESVDLVDARSAVLARVGGAVVHLVAAVDSVESGRTQTHVTVIRRVATGGTVKAGTIGARVLSRRLAPVAVESVGAVTSCIGSMTLERVPKRLISNSRRLQRVK